MTGGLGHGEIQELLGAYALDAVDGVERTAVERHLACCRRCADEVEQHREAAALLAHGSDPLPELLWQGIAEELDTPAEPVASPAPPPPPRPRRARGRPIAAWSLAGVASAAAAAAIGALSVKVADQAAEIDRLTAATPGIVGIADAASSALADGSGRRLVLRSGDGAIAVDAVVLPDGSGFLLGDSLVSLSPGRTYQLWAIVGERAISAGVLGAEPGVAAFHVDGPIEGLALTEEEAGGVIASANAPVAAWLRGS